MEYRKLYRSRTDRKLAGICGGLNHFGMDPVIIRIIFIVLTFWRSGLSYTLLWHSLFRMNPEMGTTKKMTDGRTI